MTITDVELKTIAPQRVLALHQFVGEEADANELDVEALFERVIALMDDASADRASPISWRDDDEHTLRLHAGFLAPARTCRASMSSSFRESQSRRLCDAGGPLRT